ncbi:hypothetical protein [Bacillus cereus group sp. BfR-BA-01318]|uniref:hypothetical protein n=1 Tax=Bacillus cereus group sp. BfR-BA-01318 TaxID=2920295 RepID=UPI001F5708AE|nr:hypothetical protein [Bacillus cereus group sp. BfR-BA-01318]
MTEEELQQQQEGQAQDKERAFTQADIDEAVTQAMAKRDEGERIQQERAQAMARLDNAFAEANTLKENKKLYKDAVKRLDKEGLPESLAGMIQDKDSRIMNERIAIMKAVIHTETTRAIKKSMAGGIPKQTTGVEMGGIDPVNTAFSKEL